MVKKKGLKKFNISNRLAYTLIVILSLALFGIGVYAFGVVPNPGHPVSQLQTCDNNGQTLVMSGGVWTCATPSSTDTRFTISASGLCYNTPTACVLNPRGCYLDMYHSIPLSNCNSAPQATKNTMCSGFCNNRVACEGSIASQCNGGTNVKYSYVSSSCSTSDILECYCTASGSYSEEQYIPAGQRCI